MSPACESYADWQGPPACGKPAACKFRIACVHEHINEAAVCLACAAEIMRGGGWECVPCLESAEPHGCPVVPTLTELFAAAESHGAVS